jgi:hypothetical protein
MLGSLWRRAFGRLAGGGSGSWGSSGSSGSSPPAPEPERAKEEVVVLEEDGEEGQKRKCKQRRKSKNKKKKERRKKEVGKEEEGEVELKDDDDDATGAVERQRVDVGAADKSSSLFLSCNTNVAVGARVRVAQTMNGVVALIREDSPEEKGGGGVVGLPWKSSKGAMAVVVLDAPARIRRLRSRDGPILNGDESLRLRLKIRKEVFWPVRGSTQLQQVEPCAEPKQPLAHVRANQGYAMYLCCQCAFPVAASRAVECPEHSHTFCADHACDLAVNAPPSLLITLRDARDRLRDMGIVYAASWAQAALAEGGCGDSKAAVRWAADQSCDPFTRCPSCSCMLVGSELGAIEDNLNRIISESCPSTKKVRVRYPDVKKRKGMSESELSVEEGCSWENLLRLCRRMAGLPQGAEMDLFIEKSGSVKEQLVWLDGLRSGDVVVVEPHNGFRMPTVGWLEPISVDHNPLHTSEAMVGQVRAWYGDMRSIRNDGSCYYRALGFRAFEYYISRGELDHLIEILRGVSFPQEAHAAAHLRLLQRMEAAGKGLGWKLADCCADNVQGTALSPAEILAQLEEDIRDDESETDAAIVRSCRYLVSGHLRSHSDTTTGGGLTYRQIIEAQGLELEYYCSDVVEKNSEDARDFWVEMGLLPKLLGIQSFLVCIEGVDLPLYLRHAPSHVEHRIPEVHLLLHHNHYDLLYPKVDGWQGYADYDMSMSIRTIPVNNS